MSASSATTILGRFVAEWAWEATPAPVRHEAKRSLLNALGCALGVANDPAISAAIRVLTPFSGPRHVTVLGRAERLDVMGAAFVNTIAANLLDYDDTHPPTVIHPTAPVAPPTLALAEQQGLPGQAVLHALLLGAEVECRIGLAVSSGHYARGWHITSTCGVFGAAAAASRLLGLSTERTAAALGIAASLSSGLVENLATSAKNVGMGNAARNGLLAALLAEAGYEAAQAAIEGKLGWARAMGDAPDMDAMTGELGSRWEFATNSYKPYPSGIVFHAVIEACLALRDELGSDPAAIVSVSVRGNQLLLDRGDRPTLTARDARVSIAHNAAVGLVRGTAGVADFAEIDDPVVARVRTIVSAALAPDFPPGAAEVTVRLTDGRAATRRVDVAHGGPGRPLSDHELEQKFRHNAPGAAADRRIEALWALDTAKDVRPFMALMAG
jgi:2-methylcitrate dehydratase PrpD